MKRITQIFFLPKKPYYEDYNLKHAGFKKKSIDCVKYLIKEPINKGRKRQNIKQLVHGPWSKRERETNII